MPQRHRQSSTRDELAQGPYVAARVGFEPATLRMKGIKPTTEPRRPTSLSSMQMNKQLPEQGGVLSIQRLCATFLYPADPGEDRSSEDSTAQEQLS